MKKIKENWLIILSFILSIAIYFLLVGNYIVKIYDSIDVNIWKYITDRIANGQIIYRDIFDHKGPILYLFYYLCKDYILLSEWIIFMIDEVLIYKISKLLIKENKLNLKNVIVTAICMMLFILTLQDFPNTETYSIPFILVSLYYFIKNLKCKLHEKSFVIIGFCMSVVMFLKINMVALWVVIYFYFLIKLVREKRIKQIIKMVLYTSLGVAIGVLPILIYLIHNGILKDFIDCYYRFNLKYATGNKQNSIIDTIYFLSQISIYMYPILLIMNVSAIFVEKNKDNKCLLKFNLAYFLLSILVVILPKNFYLHYLTILMPCTIIVISYFLEKIENGDNKIVLFVTFHILMLLIFTRNTYTISAIQRSKEIRSEINPIVNWLQENTKEEDNILVLGNKTVIYNLSKRSYQGKYFYQNPIIYYDVEIENQILEEIRMQNPDYIIGDQKILNLPDIKKMIDDKYIQIEKYLYRRMEI